MSQRDIATTVGTDKRTVGRDLKKKTGGACAPPGQTTIGHDGKSYQRVTAEIAN